MYNDIGNLKLYFYILIYLKYIIIILALMIDIGCLLLYN